MGPRIAPLRGVHEDTVQKALGIGPDQILHERGIYEAPVNEGLAGAPVLGRVPADDVILSEEWLTEDELRTRFSSDSRLAAALPAGRIKRLDADPRIVLFEDIDPPQNSLGPVMLIRDRTWLMDTRGQPAALVLADGDQRSLVLWGERGAIRLFALCPAA